jgi:hypothetical protein
LSTERNVYAFAFAFAFISDCAIALVQAGADKDVKDKVLYDPCLTQPLSSSLPLSLSLSLLQTFDRYTSSQITNTYENFHVLSDLLLIYICKLHWNCNPLQTGRNALMLAASDAMRSCIVYTKKKNVVGETEKLEKEGN